MSHEVNDRVWEDVWEAVEQMSLEEVREFLLSNLHSQEEVSRLNEVELREAVAEDMFNLRGVLRMRIEEALDILDEFIYDEMQKSNDKKMKDELQEAWNKIIEEVTT